MLAQHPGETLDLRTMTSSRAARSAPQRALRRAVRLAALAATVAIAPVLSGWGTADHYIRYSREHGGSCSAMIPYYGPDKLWIAHFSGGKPMDVSAERDFVDWRAGESCFFSLPDCERWLGGVIRKWPMEPGQAWCHSLAGPPVKPGARVPLKK